MCSDPWMDPVVMTTPGYGARSSRPVYGSFAPGSGANTSPRMSAPYRFVYDTGTISPRLPDHSDRYGLPEFHPGTTAPGSSAGRVGAAAWANNCAAHAAPCVC